MCATPLQCHQLLRVNNSERALVTLREHTAMTIHYSIVIQYRIEWFIDGDT